MLGWKLNMNIQKFLSPEPWKSTILIICPHLLPFNPLAGAIDSVCKKKKTKKPTLKTITSPISFAIVKSPSSLAYTTVYYPSAHPLSKDHWTPAMCQELFWAQGTHH